MISRQEFNSALDAAIARRARERRTSRRVAWLPLAATLVVGIVTGIVAGIFAGILTRPAPRPTLVARHELAPSSARGIAAQQVYELPANEQQYVLVATLTERWNYSAYRVEIVGEKVIWSAEGVQPDDDNAFTISVPRALLRGGTYRIDVYGGGDLLQSFPFQLQPPPSAR
ncbi:MAG TPA: hypothetical protein VF698_08480 [Thermoanaerobaculia bacterium]|jgi:hypothetical protein